MNNKQQPDFVGGQGRGSNQNPLQNNDNLLINDLRRPYVTPPEVQQDSRTSSVTEQNIPVSMLSADAPEFVPRFDQNRVIEHNSHVSTVPLQPGPSVSNESFGLSAPQLKYVYHPLIVEINNLVVKLSLNPQKCENVEKKMASALSKVTDRELMKEAVSVIFEQGVGEPNFRFSGGRLCQHLSKNVQHFKSLLLQRCQEEFLWRNHYIEREQSRVCGFTLFLGDIYVKVLTTTSQPLGKLSEALCSLQLLLLSVHVDSTLKCVVQSLKVTGSLLDRCSKEFLNAVMDTVKDVALTAKVPDNIRSQLLSVVELRASNWDRNQDENAATSNQQTQQTQHLGTVFYGADGKVERVEEENIDSSSSDSEDLQSCVALENEMDEEVSRDFEEFLKIQNS